MILCIDVGNTNIKYAVFDNDNLLASFRVSSRHSRTADEYGVILINLLKNSEIDVKKIEGIILSSVIPNLNYTITHMCEYFFNLSPLMVSPELKMPISVCVDNPHEVGADILASCTAVYTKYKCDKPIVTIDFGTATTFDIISKDGALLGVTIAPGIKSSLEGLVSSTAQLPRIELESPGIAFGKNTIKSMQAGMIYGFAGLVSNIVKNIKKEVGDAVVIATGGLSEVIFKEVDCINFIDRRLTLEGLNILYNLNK